jgi:hypothetical protein
MNNNLGDGGTNNQAALFNTLARLSGVNVDTNNNDDGRGKKRSRFRVFLVLRRHSDLVVGRY